MHLSGCTNCDPLRERPRLAAIRLAAMFEQRARINRSGVRRPARWRSWLRCLPGSRALRGLRACRDLHRHRLRRRQLWRWRRTLAHRVGWHRARRTSSVELYRVEQWQLDRHGDHQRQRRLHTDLRQHQPADARARGERHRAIVAHRRHHLHHLRARADLSHRCHQRRRGRRHQSGRRRSAGIERCSGQSRHLELLDADRRRPCAAVHHHGDTRGEQFDHQRHRFRIQLRHGREHARRHGLRRDQLELSLPGFAAPVHHQFERAGRRGRLEPVGQRADRWHRQLPAGRLRVQHFHDPERRARGRRRRDHAGRRAARDLGRQLRVSMPRRRP